MKDISIQINQGRDSVNADTIAIQKLTVGLNNPNKTNCVKIDFIFKAPLTENKLRKLAEDAVDVEKTYEIVKKLKVKNKLGLHARPLAELVKKAQNFSSTITIEKDGEKVDTKSIISMLTLCLTKGAEIKLRAKGISPEVVESELDELLQICDMSGYVPERVFEEQRITVDISRAIDVDKKLGMINEEINYERKTFLMLVVGSAEHSSKYKGLTEAELREIASQLSYLANIKGMRNDILKMMQQNSFEPETNIEIYMRDSNTIFHLIGRDGISRIIESENISEELIAHFNHMQILRPIDEFSFEVFPVLNGSHAYEVKRIQNNLAIYYDALESFLNAQIEEFRPTFNRALKKRMNYEHHRFIGIKSHQI